MAPSGSRGVLVAACAAGLGVAAAGCATTRQEAARLQLNAARIRAAERPMRVTRSGHRLVVRHVSLLSTAHGSAVVVQVHNPGDVAVSDLPISVGVRGARGPAEYLNLKGTGEYSYYESHLPAVAAGASLSWVFTTGKALPAHAHPFARVGGHAGPAATVAGLPAVSARLAAGRGPGRRGAVSSLRVSLHNASSLPQYQLQVYAVARRHGRVVAAGALTVPHLGTGRTLAVTLRVIGPLGTLHPDLTVDPTIFQ